MDYKINVRTGSNAWLNLLQDQYVEHDFNQTGIGTSATNNVELALKFLFDNKIERVVDTAAPTVTDDDHQIGTIWVDTTNDVSYVCLDNASGAAVWHSSGLTQEEVEDIVGAMVTGNIENGISVTYDDPAGKLNFDVNDPTITLAGDVNGSAQMVDLANVSITTTVSGGYYTTADADSTFVEVAGDTMTGPLQVNSTIQANTGVAVNEFSSDGTLAGNSDTAIPTEQAVKTYVDAAISGLDWQQSVLDKDLNDPPASPSIGDRYLVSYPASAATGDWAGHDNEITEWDGSAWQFTSLSEGMATWIEDEDVVYVWNGTVWAKLGTTITHNNTSGIQGGNTTERFHLTSAEHTAITGSKTQNTVFAAPDGSAGVGSFRALVSDDIPTLASTKISDFTEAAQDAVGAAITAGTQENISVTYNDAGNKIDYLVNIAVGSDSSLLSNAGLASFDSDFFYVNGSGYVTLEESYIDHGHLSGLDDDDHTQYVHISNARTITAQHTFAPTVAQAPFTLGANAQAQLVSGLDVEYINDRRIYVETNANEPATVSANDVWIEVA